MKKEQYKKFFEEIGLAKGIANIKKFQDEIMIPEIIKAKKELFSDIKDWLSQEGENDWRAWDSDYLDEYDKLKKKHLNQ